MAVCRVCQGSGKLLKSDCPLCEGDPKFFEDEEEEKPKMQSVWWVDLGNHWVQFDAETQDLLREAETRPIGNRAVTFFARGQPYRVDIDALAQINTSTQMVRDVKRTEETVKEEEKEEEEEEEESDDEGCRRPPRSYKPEPVPERTPRHQSLVEVLLSSKVQVSLPAEAKEEPARLSPDEVKQVFKDHVPGVEKWLFRDIPGEYSLEFLAIAYKGGLRAFHGTDMHNHLMWLMRSVVHHGHEKKPGCARFLREIAEAFLDCQAVQARVIERAGLEILGVSQNFVGLLKALLGDEKTMVLKMLAQDHLQRGYVSDDGNPTHYENRLTADLGPALGLNEDDVRRAGLDQHAGNRFGKLTGKKKDEALARFRELFDLESFLKTLTDEINRHSEKSEQDTLPCQFIAWAKNSLKVPHVIFDDTCMKVEVEKPLVLATLEALFSGKLSGAADETYREHTLTELFEPLFTAAAAPTDAPTDEAAKDGGDKGTEADKKEDASSKKADTGKGGGKSKAKAKAKNKSKKGAS